MPDNSKKLTKFEHDEKASDTRLRIPEYLKHPHIGKPPYDAKHRKE